MSTPPPASLSVRGLAKHYGDVAALRGVDFEVAAGEIFGLLGLNGAGKTTTLECILGLRRPDAGAVSVNGVDALAFCSGARQRIGAQLQFAGLPDKMTVQQAICLFGSFYPDAATSDELLQQFDLGAKADASFDTLSSGQKQRLFLALAVVNRPTLVVLDEPTAGLDPQSRRDLHRMLAGMKAAGRSVLLSTHDLEEARHQCDRIGILHEGRLVAMGTPAALIAASRTPPRVWFRAARPVEPSMPGGLAGVVGTEANGDRWGLVTTEAARTIGELVRKLEADRNELLDLQVQRPSLEDVFLEITGAAWCPGPSEEIP